MTNDLAAAQLDRFRKRLLDTTGRNRLLNLPERGRLPIALPAPDLLWERLLSEQELRFVPVPDPGREELIASGYLELDPATGQERRLRKGLTAKEWGEGIGWLDPNDISLQEREMRIPLFPAELEGRLRTLHKNARSAIEETGANVLYCLFGLLEWFEPGKPEPRFAPLLTLPVRLNRGRLNKALGLYEFTLAYTGEEFAHNLSLQKRLWADFSLELPDPSISAGEPPADPRAILPPAAYGARVQEWLARNSAKCAAWRVHPWTGLALLNFAKLRMYRDLDPAAWPEGHPIAGHSLVRRLFGGAPPPTGTETTAAALPIDELAQVHQRYPLVEDADSSQHGALKDALDGRDLVIEGPPGTGKSQTITNLIAAALAEGQRVLFVAEKQAALAVVKRRLDQAGLGNFCLELHSHQSRKAEVAASLKARLDREFPPPEGFDAKVAAYEEAKEQLRRYAGLLNQRWQATDWTVHQILMQAARYREALKIDPALLHPQGIAWDRFDPAARQRDQDRAAMLAAALKALLEPLPPGQGVAHHPWHGIPGGTLQWSDTDRIRAELGAWQEALTGLAAWRSTLAQRLGVEPAAIPDELQGLTELGAELAKLPAPPADELLAALPSLRGDGLERFRRYLALFREARELRDALAPFVRAERLADLEALDELTGRWEAVRALAAPETEIGRLKLSRSDLGMLEQRVRVAAERIRPVAEALGAELFPATEAGLAEFAGVLELASALRPALWSRRDERFEQEALDELLPKLQRTIQHLHAEQDALQRLFDLKALPDLAELKSLWLVAGSRNPLRWLSREWREARQRALGWRSGPAVGFGEIKAGIPRAIRVLEERSALADDPQAAALLGDRFAGMASPIDDLLELREWFRRVQRRFGADLGPRAALRPAILRLPERLLRAIHGLIEQGVLDEIRELLEELKGLRETFAPVFGQEPIPRVLGEEGLLARLGAALDLALEPCLPWFRQTGQRLDHLAWCVATLQRLDGLRREWLGLDLDRRWFDGALALRIDEPSGPSPALDAAHSLLAFAGWLENELKSDLLRAAILAQPRGALIADLLGQSSTLGAALNQEAQASAGFLQRNGIDFSAWSGDSASGIAALIARNQRALDRPEGFAHWLTYLRAREPFQLAGYAGILALAESGALPAERIEDAWRLAVSDALAGELFRVHPELLQVSRTGMETLRQRFRQQDSELKALQRRRIAALAASRPIPEGQAGARVGDYTDMVLIRRECAKQQKHLPLRQLLARAGQAVQALKPCFLMGPMSVAQYLTPGVVRFDLVVMDEASQMRPEDALGAIARGARLVVVGDPKQLPPTRFFAGGEDDPDNPADDAPLEESDSILDALRPLFPTRRLRWHYRSRHESLIAFSNRHFYDDDLVVFPSPFHDSAEFGIKWTRVHHGRFRGQQNLEEVRVIAEAVRRHLLERPQESLGVVAMNVRQRDQIEREIETLAKEDDRLLAALEANQERDEPLFVKNLENVQGDERDVIYISITYGPAEPGGPVPQRFGPINQGDGWRRLNVLFTRSKKRMHIFSSMGADDVAVTPASSTGVKALREFLAFAERLGRNAHPDQALAATGEDDASGDFAWLLGQRLAREGYVCHQRVGAAESRFDLAVQDPNAPGRYLMGIESDGAVYASAHSMRDADRLRPAVLEGLQWTIHRTCAIDWYRNAEEETRAILAELQRTATTAEKPVQAEAEEIEQAVTAREERETELERQLSAALSLRERLMRYDREVIRPACPDTPEAARLLRTEMVEALLEARPASKSEFQEQIPRHLREVTAANEAGRFLDEVLALIGEATGEEG